MSDAEIVELNIPTGIPLVYELDEHLKPIRHYYLGDAERVQKAMQSVATQASLTRLATDFTVRHPTSLRRRRGAPGNRSHSLAAVNQPRTGEGRQKTTYERLKETENNTAANRSDAVHVGQTAEKVNVTTDLPGAGSSWNRTRRKAICGE